MSDKVTVFTTSIASNSRVILSQESRIETALKSIKCEFEFVDVSSDKSLVTRMREIAGPEALVIQFARGDQYLGNYSAFEEAVELGTVPDFLKMN